jgi:hypothetical protein
MAMVASSSTKRIAGVERFLDFEIGYQVIIAKEGVMNDEHGFDHTFGHQDGKSQEMQTNQAFRQPATLAVSNPITSAISLALTFMERAEYSSAVRSWAHQAWVLGNCLLRDCLSSRDLRVQQHDRGALGSRFVTSTLKRDSFLVILEGVVRFAQVLAMVQGKRSDRAARKFAASRAT